MPSSHELAHRVATLRAHHPDAAALVLLDLALFEERADDTPALERIDPTSALGREIVAAFDGAMSPDDWDAYAGEGADCYVKAAMLDVWVREVLPRFAGRYGIELKR